MEAIHTALGHLTGTEIADALVHTLEKNFEDFAEAKEQFEDAMCILRQELGEPPVDNLVDAIHRQIASELLFSGVLGIKANLDHFIDPIARNFLEVDPETYLRENIARQLPEYKRALDIRNQFLAQLSPEQQKTYEAVITYISLLETAGPKLAHYYGYLLGSEILPRIIPGYHSDDLLTLRYRMMLTNYFGNDILENSAFLP